MQGYLDEGFCVADPSSDYEGALCNRVVCEKDALVHSTHGDNAHANCCTGSICVVSTGESFGAGSCAACTGTGTKCEGGGKSRCCPGLRCDIYSETCEPLKKKGESCTYPFHCEDGLTCEDDLCATPKAPPPSTGSSDGDRGGTTSCDPKSCSGTQGDCSGGFCFFCTYFCEGNTCQQRCTD